MTNERIIHELERAFQHALLDHDRRTAARIARILERLTR
jgi:hypothetical protein